MTDIITLGELLIDLTQSSTDDNGNGIFTAYPGGAPANVAVAASRLGAATGFIGKVGNDAFGRSLAETLKKDNVNTKGLYFDGSQHTTMAIVSVDERGEREFSFYRDPGADTQLTAEEALAALSEDMPKILHVGSLSLTTSPAKEACIEAVKYARENGAIISYDPNYRAALWDSEEHAVEMMKTLLPYADILKVSDEEMEMLTLVGDFEEGSRILSEYGPSIVLVTLGSDGVFVRMGSRSTTVPGFSVQVADTNGAGDTFFGAMLKQIATGMTDSEDVWTQLTGMVRYANKAASLTCSRHGAIPAMPTLAEMEQEF